ncbi:MAG: conserved phage C-terminal domain-containing protein [Oscillospiraceae bacterium]
MAQKRMFDKSIIDSDAFLDMPQTTQLLYFHLNMRADDEGFLNNPKRIMRMIGSSDDDMNILISKKFVLIFESGVIVIKHWKINNYLRNDRVKPTTCITEKALVQSKDNGAYTFGIPNDNQMTTIGIHSIEEIRLEEIRLEEIRLEEIRLEEIRLEENELLHNSCVFKNFSKNDLISILQEYQIKKDKTIETLPQKRFKEMNKYSIEEIKRMLAYFKVQWSNPKMNKYLRVSTLFNSKFNERMIEALDANVDLRMTQNFSLEAKDIII